jgi:pimeloyl-ACP methyl ester carboxylesterase
MQPTDVTVEVATGVRLRVRAWTLTADGGRPPHLLIHGLSSNARLWDAVAKRLAAAGHAAYAVDLRSHGESDAPDVGYDTATAARDVAALCRGLGLRRVNVAGQSWGGNVAVRLAAEQPDLVFSLALVDGGWIDLSTEFSSWEECAAALRPPDVDGLRPDDVRGYLWREHPDWSAEAVEATLANLRVTSTGHLVRRLSIKRHMLIVRSMWDDPPWDDLPGIGVPVLLLPAIPVDEGGAAQRRARVAKAADALAHATVREYVGADHDLHAQRPAQLADDLLTLATGSQV